MERLRNIEISRDELLHYLNLNTNLTGREGKIFNGIHPNEARKIFHVPINGTKKELEKFYAASENKAQKLALLHEKNIDNDIVPIRTISYDKILVGYDMTSSSLSTPETMTIENLEQLVNLWNKINYRTTERVYDSTNVSESDTIYRSENIYRSCDSSDCKNLIFSDGCQSCEYLLASQRSGHCSFCIRCDDSSGCSNSYNISCSSKISNSFFIEDCGSLHECMFCAHISNKKYCICNMQFDKDEYFAIKKEIIQWIMNS